jgi:hypothetical protein
LNVLEPNYLEPVRNHLTDAGKHLRMALSALDPKGVAADQKRYADLEIRLRSALAWTEAAYHESRRLKG